MEIVASTKTIEYYLSLPYTIEIIPDLENGGYFAQIKELRGCMTQAETWQELELMIQEAKELWLETRLEHNRHIPEPEVTPTPQG